MDIAVLLLSMCFFFAIGMPIAVGQMVSLANLTTLKFIEQAASAALNVNYYK